MLMIKKKKATLGGENSETGQPSTEEKIKLGDQEAEEKEDEEEEEKENHEGSGVKKIVIDSPPSRKVHLQDLPFAC